MKKLDQIRQECHHLCEPAFATPGELVAYMGAMQAQDYGRSKWAVGLRIKGGTLKVVNEALQKGEIVRTHVMRPTWHWVAAKDLRWMLKLSSQRLRKALDSWTKGLGLNIPETLYTRSNDHIGKMLSGGYHLTKEEIETGLSEAGMDTSPDMMRRYLLRAEVEGIICSGRDKEGKPTYALIDEWIAPAEDISQEEALARLALCYFRSHSPATLKDFSWWSGFTLREAKLAVSLSGNQIQGWEEGEFLVYASCKGKQTENVVHFLPPYDEYLIGYKDRQTVMDTRHFSKAFNKWGIFYPIVLYNGRIIGNWNKTVKQGQMNLVVVPFEPDAVMGPPELYQEAEERYRRFYNS